MNNKTYLCVTIFGGWFGLHKFLTNNTTTGILYLFTFGLFGIGWIVDIIIAIQNLTSNQPTFTYSTTIRKSQENMQPIILNYNTKLIRYSNYKVSGINPESNKKKSVTVIAKNGDSEDNIASKSNLLPPYTVILDDRQPTENQIKYAKDLGVKILPNLTFNDVSCLISKALGEAKNDFTTNDIIEYAGERGTLISPYSDLVGSLHSILCLLKDADHAAFWTYIMFCTSHNIEIGYFDKLNPFDSRFYFFESLKDRDKFIGFFASLSYNQLESVCNHCKLTFQGSHDKASLYQDVCTYIKHL